MSLTKYLNTIKSIDPGHIYIENVRSVLNVSRFRAILLCEMAVSYGTFEKKVGVFCPNEDRIIESYSAESEIPEEIKCFICEALDENDFVFKTNRLRKITFYQLRKHA